MMQKRRQYTQQFKFKVALEAASTAWQKRLFIYYDKMKRRIPRGAKPEQLQVSARQEQILTRIIRRSKSPQYLVVRAKIVLQAALCAGSVINLSSIRASRCFGCFFVIQ